MLQSTSGGLLTLVICLAIAVLANFYFPGHPAWIVTVLAVVCFMFQVGLGVSGRIDGIIIDNRNRVSLSKLQAALWTIVILSALIAVVGFNLSKDCGAASLEVTMPPELLIAMGISAASLVATPAILSLKTSQAPAAVDVAAANQTMANDKAEGGPKLFGLLMGRTSSADASWRDIFRGDEVGNFSSADLSKVQAVLITLVLLGVYIATFWASGFAGKAQCVAALPPINDNFIWLLAVSHAGYLAYKVAPHSATDGGSPDASNAENTSSDPRNQPVG